jgi:hypothetical protein
MRARFRIAALAVVAAACRFGGPSGNPSTPLDLPDLLDASAEQQDAADGTASSSSGGGSTDSGPSDDGSTDGGSSGDASSGDDVNSDGNDEAEAACCSMADGSGALPLCDAACE